MAAPDTTGGARAWAMGLAAVLGVLSVVFGAWVLALVFGALVLQAFALTRLPATVVAGPQVEGSPVRAAAGAVLARVWSPFRRFAFTLLPVLVGAVAVLVALDWSAGTVWEGWTESPAPTVSGQDLTRTDLPPTTDKRATAVAYDGQDWVDRYFRELDQLQYHYVPFIGPRVEPVEGRYINSRGGVRRSYEPEGLDGASPEVWFFGGSTMWGEGQRDLHTIPSEVARLAEAEGLPFRVVNFGERGYTAFQEFLLLEQEIADRGAPDVAVFYDGVNELGVQREVAEEYRDQPTMYQVQRMNSAFETAPPLPEGTAPDEPSLWSEYVDTSVLTRLGRQISDLGVVTSAAAQDDFEPETPEEYRRVLENAWVMYARAVDLIQHLGERSGTRVELFWQPGNDPPRDLVVERGVHDISEAFDSVNPDRLFIDGGHTNEYGARVAAAAIWEHLRPTVEAVGSG